MLVDAAVTGANGVAYLAAATLLTTPLGPPVPLLLGIGVFLVCYAVVIVLVGRARPIPVVGAWFAIVLNLAWTTASLTVAFTAERLTAAGRIWDVLQALVVLGFAVAQMMGLRKARQ
ncbi:hypothetical protein [Actinocatenispora rupis]|uniref:Uncharacterized protein n=1 Tax=Actinocatenispora rupis TaxID=519421 RepID=A0A8J3JI09_9ACTN|nr:hypothetical protein [Actinocatenispora rupis]GID15333.1 hypothetical protein Aru02nite_62220 [Actinocatenispora rupis]